MSGMAYVKVGCPKLVVKLAGYYGQNMFDYTMLGGYAESVPEDNVQGFVTYSNINTFSGWLDILTPGKKMQGGLFLGYTKNLGGEKNDPVLYSRGNNIDHVYRASGRFIYNVGKFRIAPEVEYTVAGYGKTQQDATVEVAKTVSNIRFLLGVYFFF
jgi:hypothetical protein